MNITILAWINEDKFLKNLYLIFIQYWRDHPIISVKFENNLTEIACQKKNTSLDEGNKIRRNIE